MFTFGQPAKFTRIFTWKNYVAKAPDYVVASPKHEKRKTHQSIKVYLPTYSCRYIKGIH